MLCSIIMAETGIFCSGAHVIHKAGAKVSTTAITQAYYNDFIAQAESLINVSCRYNFSDNYTSLNADVKQILREAASDLAAIYAIQYDMSGYMSSTAESMITVLRDAAMRAISILRDKKQQDFINGA